MIRSQTVLTVICAAAVAAEAPNHATMTTTTGRAPTTVQDPAIS
jgi:hypothetical protein